MSQNHIIEVRGGPHDGGLLDLAHIYDGPPPADTPTSLFAIPVHTDPDGRHWLAWADIEALPTADEIAGKAAAVERMLGCRAPRGGSHHGPGEQ